LEPLGPPGTPLFSLGAPGRWGRRRRVNGLATFFGHNALCSEPLNQENAVTTGPCPRCGRFAPALPTHHVACAECGEDRWPVAAHRPRRYTCSRCSSLTPAERGRRRKVAGDAARTRRTRLRASSDTTEAATEPLEAAR
jgi:hypothetical protein